MEIIDMPDLSKLSLEELEKLLHKITLESRPIVDELCKRYQQTKKDSNLKKAS